MTAVLWNDQSLLGCWVDTKWQSSTYQIVAKTQQNVHFWRTSKWFFCIWNWTSKKGEKWFLGQGGLGVHQQANMVLMEENPNNHLGCMKTLVNDGIFTVSTYQLVIAGFLPSTAWTCTLTFILTFILIFISFLISFSFLLLLLLLLLVAVVFIFSYSFSQPPTRFKPSHGCCLLLFAIAWWFCCFFLLDPDVRMVAVCSLLFSCWLLVLSCPTLWPNSDRPTTSPFGMLFESPCCMWVPPRLNYWWSHLSRNQSRS